VRQDEFLAFVQCVEYYSFVGEFRKVACDVIAKIGAINPLVAMHDSDVLRISPIPYRERAGFEINVQDGRHVVHL